MEILSSLFKLQFFALIVLIKIIDEIIGIPKSFRTPPTTLQERH